MKLEDLDTITIFSDNQEIKIYVLLEINKDNKTYILYAKELPILKENIYAGELTDTQLLPVDTKLIPYFEKLIDLILKKAE